MKRCKITTKRGTFQSCPPVPSLSQCSVFFCRVQGCELSKEAGERDTGRRIKGYGKRKKEIREAGERDTGSGSKGYGKRE